MRWQEMDDADNSRRCRLDNRKGKRRLYEEDALPVKKKSGKRRHRKETFKDELLEEYVVGRDSE